jgi:hypothetical protein
MSKRTSSMGSERRLAGMLFQERIFGTDAEIAAVHETNRQSVVKEVLVHVFFLAKFGFIHGAVTARKAQNQYLVATGNDQAAHCAPGQIMAGTQTIQSLINGSDDLQLVVENLFAKTDEIHLKFNMADSRAEENGLRAAFGSACANAANASRTTRFNRAEEFYPYIDAAYAVYKTQGTMALTNALNIQRQKLQRGEPLKGATRQEMISILEGYRSKLSSSLNSLETVQGLFPEELWREYRELV